LDVVKRRAQLLIILGVLFVPELTSTPIWITLKKAIMRVRESSEGQLLFDKNLRGWGKAAKIVFYAIVFSPLFASAIGIASLFLSWKAPGHVWLLVTVGGAFVLYLILAWLKVVINRLRRHHSVWWIILFLFCVSTTCIVPGYVCYPIVRWISCRYQPVVWALEVAFGYFVYGQYNFLNSHLPFINRRRG
jgi:hypothetical protein